MLRFIGLVLCLIFVLNLNIYALENPLVNIRQKLFEESQLIKPLLSSSKDVVLLNSFWDALIMTVSQLDAYFSMLRIFNTIKKEALTEEAVKVLIDWLSMIKKTNELNLASLHSLTINVEEDTKLHLDNLRQYYTELNTLIDIELNKHTIIITSLKTKR
ncbi:MAG: hypothetical protein NC912_00830 [Candidatus Omnitrophica bacterium]|nr:hypothetical protein [Candidatus Omnitrophota bacterium]